ncbi:MAG: class I SAM-dependent methyltransferase [Acidobacteriota bacterium]
MKFKPEWLPHLHRFRARELEMAFRDCPGKQFVSGLELGAGDGFQSVLLSRYVTRLVSTDYDPAILRNEQTETISYRTCDAERVDRGFAPGEFDLVYSSNLLEHLSDLPRALEAMRTVLADDGLAIHIVPSPFWKICHLALHVPNRILVILERLTGKGGVAAAIRKIKGSGQRAATIGRADNNPKVSRRPRSSWSRMLVPEPHGAAAGHLEELRMFRRSHWTRRFLQAGFSVVAIRKGPVASGYGFGLDRLRRFLEGIGLTSEFIYVVVKKGTVSRHQSYFL